MKYNPRQLFLQYNLPDSPIKLAVMTKYDTKLKEWKFSAYVCKLCDTALKFENSALKHATTCKRLNSNKKEKTND